MARKGNTDGAPLWVLHSAFDTSETSLTPAAFSYHIVSVIVQCNETNASGTVKLQRNGTDITSTIVCDTNHELSGLGNADGAGAPGTIDDAQYIVSKGDVIKLVPANNANGQCFILAVRV
jgi:hypothetical protein